MKTQKEYEEHLKMREELWVDYDRQATLQPTVEDEQVNGFIDSHEVDFDRHDKEAILTYLANDEHPEYRVQDLYKLTDPSLRSDVEVASRFISLDGICYEDAPADIKANKEILILASKTNGWALSAAPGHLQDDEDVVLQCTRNKRNNFGHASERIQEMCRGQDPVKYLESKMMADELKASLTNKAESKQQKKLKM